VVLILFPGPETPGGYADAQKGMLDGRLVPDPGVVARKRLVSLILLTFFHVSGR